MEAKIVTIFMTLLYKFIFKLIVYFVIVIKKLRAHG